MFKIKLPRFFVTLLAAVLGTEQAAPAPAKPIHNNAQCAPSRYHKWQPYREDSYCHYLPH